MRILVATISFLCLLPSSYSQESIPQMPAISTENSYKSLGLDIGLLDDLRISEVDQNSLDQISRLWKNIEIGESRLTNGDLSVLQVVPTTSAAYELSQSVDAALQELLNRNFSNLSPEEINCNNSANDWKYVINLYSKKAGGGPLPKIIQKVISEGVQNEFESLVRAYQEDCLSNSIPEDLVASGLTKVSAFILVNDHPRCGAYRLAQNIFITAKHCFYHEVTGYQYLEISDVRIAVLEDPDDQVPVTHISSSVTNQNLTPVEAPFGVIQDYVYLYTNQLRTSMPSAIVQASFGQTGERVFLLGYYRFHEPAKLFEPPIGETDDRDWVNGLRWTDSRQCVIGEVSNVCGIHYCQSDAQFSGAPVFRRSTADGVLSFAGLHVSSMGNNSGCSVSSAVHEGNITIPIPGL